MGYRRGELTHREDVTAIRDNLAWAPRSCSFARFRSSISTMTADISSRFRTHRREEGCGRGTSPEEPNRVSTEGPASRALPRRPRARAWGFPIRICKPGDGAANRRRCEVATDPGMTLRSLSGIVDQTLVSVGRKAAVVGGDTLERAAFGRTRRYRRYLRAMASVLVLGKGAGSLTAFRFAIENRGDNQCSLFCSYASSPRACPQAPVTPTFPKRSRCEILWARGGTAYYG